MVPPSSSLTKSPRGITTAWKYFHAHATEEIGRLYAALDARPKRRAADAVRLILLTGARRNEVLGAR